MSSHTTTAAKAPAVVRHPWGIVLLLSLGMCVNFFDRGNLAIAAPVMAPQLGLSQWEVGLLLSAFFWTYSITLIGAGWVVDRMEARWVYAIGFVLWSAATLSTAFVSTFAGLLVMRMLLGVGESVTYPSNSRILATVFPERRRGLANAVTDLGARIGPLFGTLCGALLIGKYGWRGLFLVTGAAGLLWVVPWLIWAPRGSVGRVSAKGPAIGWKQLLVRRDVWGTFGGLFGANYAWYFILTWLPSYLVRERHLTMGSVAIWGALPYLFMAVSLVACGYLADRWIGRGGSPVRVRRTFLVTGLLAASALMPLSLLPDIRWALAGLFVTCLAFGVYVSNLWAMTQTLAGPQAAGRWTGMQNACGNLAGVLSPALTGFLIARTGHFALAFIASSVACLFGAASFGLLIRDPNEKGGRPVPAA